MRTDSLIAPEQIAALPMYDFPQLRDAHDAFWSAFAQRLVESGVSKVPERLTRNLEHTDVWGHPSLLFGQACEYPLTKSFENRLTLVATPRYSAPGCEGAAYRSAIVVRVQDDSETMEGLRNRRCVINEPDSNSGMNLLRAAVAPVVIGTRFFRSVQVSGSHRQSLEWVATNQADVAAIDCVSFAHFQSLDPELTAKVRILCWSPASPSLPFVTARDTDDATLEVLRRELEAVIADPDMAPVCQQLLLDGVDAEPDVTLSQVLRLERAAGQMRYPALL